MTSDPISDMLLRIRNGLKAGLPSIELPGSRIKGEIARVMKDEGYITNFTITNTIPRVLDIELKYNDDAEPAISGRTSQERGRSAGLTDQPEEDLDERRLAGPIGTKKSENRTGFHGKRHAA